ncbi:DUF1054 family protein [Lactiplantibacillus garii]|uniref:UPF0637 protein D1831_05505 n=1 Tax=Lactiplantibacillus garii TaxID=2306423 RepID=A0A3R8J7H7_9LACO|nr:DUF1054 family protein [Lactiplantibacillus garii]RRK10760.1 DUF1054 family protein [Lactiplantibacillus garii]
MFVRSDFATFDDPTLAGRMHLIKTVLDPKFEALAPKIIATLQPQNGQPFYGHVAKHQRRFKNPPVDTWIAFSQNKRSYKAWPHFELGFWPDRLFMYFDILDECKPSVQGKLTAVELATLLEALPADYVLTANHGAPTTSPLNQENVAATVQKFNQYKHTELVVGRSLFKADPLFDQPAALEAYILETFTTLMPLYGAMMMAMEA